MANSKNLEHFRNLVSLAAIDGKIEEVERVALSKIAFDKGIPMDRMQIMLNGAEQYVAIIPQNHEDREQQLEEMIMLAIADGDFAKAEEDLIMKVGERLGFSKFEIKNIISSTI